MEQTAIRSKAKKVHSKLKFYFFLNQKIILTTIKLNEIRGKTKFDE